MLAQNTVRSLRTRQPSSSKRPSRAAVERILEGLPSSLSTSLKKVSYGEPIISAAIYPLILSAPGFQVATEPSGSRRKYRVVRDLVHQEVVPRVPAGGVHGATLPLSGLRSYLGSGAHAMSWVSQQG